MPHRYPAEVRRQVIDYLRLRSESGLTLRRRGQAEGALAGSWSAVHLDAGEETVGVGRLGDGGWYFRIVDMAILPAHHGRGARRRWREPPGRASPAHLGTATLKSQAARRRQTFNWPSSLELVAQGSKKGQPRDRGGREALLRAAIRIVAERGFDGVTYRSVGREAGMTGQLVTYHFGSLDALIHEAAELASQDSIMGASLAPTDGRIEGFLERLVDTTERDEAAHVFQYEMALRSRRDESVAQESRTLYEEYFRIVSEALPTMGLEDLSPAMVRVLFAAIDGLMLQHFVFGDADRTEESVEALRDVLRLLADLDTRDQGPLA